MSDRHGMRLGISSYTYGWAVGTDGHRPPGALTAFDLVARAKALGVRVVQLCDNLPAETWRDDAVEALEQAARDAGVSVEVGTRGCDPAHLRRFIGVAARLGSSVLRVVVDAPGDHPPRDEVVKRIGAVAGELREAGVTLAIENHDRFPAGTLAAIVLELREAAVPVGICLDTANSLAAMEGPPVVVAALAEHTVNLHVKDVTVKRFPHLQGFTIEGRPAGQGMLDIPWLLQSVRRFGRDVSAIAELWTPPEAAVADTIAKEAAWAEQSVATLRHWIKE